LVVAGKHHSFRKKLIVNHGIDAECCLEEAISEFEKARRLV